jgi:hypothetical protein
MDSGPGGPGGPRTTHSDEGDLLQPSVSRGQHYLDPPWNPASQFYVAFFGGVIAVTAIAYLNAARLHAEHLQKRIVAMGIAGVAMALVAAYLVADSVADSDDARSYVRLASRVVAVIVHFIFMAWLKQPDRRFQVAGGDYASLWSPGFAAVAVGGIAQGILLYILVRSI